MDGARETRDEGRYYLLASGAKVYEQRPKEPSLAGEQGNLWVVSGVARDAFDPDPESEVAADERLRSSREMVPVKAVGDLAARLHEEGRLFADAARYALVHLVEEYERRLNRALEERGMNLLHQSDHVTIEFDADQRPRVSVDIQQPVYLRASRELAGRLEDYFGGFADPEEEKDDEGIWWAASEWLWTMATSSRMEKIIAEIDEDELPSDKDSIARAFMADFPSVEKLADPGSDHYLILVQRLAYEYLDALPMGELSSAQIEALVGLATEESTASVPVPEKESDHYRTGASLVWQRVREAVAQRTFAQIEGSRWPTAELTTRGRNPLTRVEGHAILKPRHLDGAEGTISPEEAEAWAHLMWQQHEELSDLDADVLDALCAVWISQVNDARESAHTTVDDLLRMRGVQAKMGGSGRRGGYRPEQREAVMHALSRLENIWITIAEMTVFEQQEGKKKGSPKRVQAQDRVFFITRRVVQMRLDGGVDVQSIRFRPGDVFARFLVGPGRQVALLSAAALAYDPYREILEKRLAKYLSWKWKSGRKSGYYQPHKVSTLLGRAGHEVETRNPQRTRDRLERALDRLRADGVIAEWQYARFCDRMETPRKGWVHEWLNSTLLIEPPDALKDVYDRMEEGSGRARKQVKITTGQPQPTLAGGAADGQKDSLLDRAKKRRKDMKLSQMRLGEILNVSQALISRLERGKEKPSPGLRKKIEGWLERTEGKKYK